MEDRRRKKRVPLSSQLNVESLFKSGEQTSIKSNFDIVITDISKGGMGFITEEVLPVDYYFNAKVVIDAEKMFYCVLKVVRVDKEETGYRYGSEFVGLAEILGHNIDEYIEECEDISSR